MRPPNLSATNGDRPSEGVRDLLVVEDLKASFDSPRGVVRAVDGVDLRVPYGQVVGVVGESGSGKSMLMKSVLGVAPRSTTVDAGCIEFDGRDVLGMDRKQQRAILGREIGFVLQDPFVSLNPVVRIGRHFTETLRRHLDIDRAEARRRGIDLLRQVGIPSPEQRFDGYPHELSGGMLQRVCVALAVACGPKLLVADEPTTALDVTTQRQILDLLADLRQGSGMSMILISHDLGIVAGQTDHLVVMYAGQVVEAGPTVDVFERPRHRYTAALIDAVPRIDAPAGQRLALIPGRPPAEIDARAGCRFAPRCEHAQTICREVSPGLVVSDTDGRQHRCFFPAEGDDVAIPLANANGGSS